MSVLPDFSEELDGVVRVLWVGLAVSALLDGLALERAEARLSKLNGVGHNGGDGLGNGAYMKHQP